MDGGPSLSRHVKKAIEAIRSTGIPHQVTPMGTVVEAESLEEIFEAAKAGVDAVSGEGSRRISLSIKVDIRMDKDITMSSKMDAVA